MREHVLYLVHHGDAVGPEVDPLRPLSERGRLEVQRLAEQAAARGVKPDIIWHSGKMRARQTAEAYWRQCNPLASFSATHGLQPTDPTNWIVDAIAGQGGSIMLAGHFPHLPRLLGRLLSGNPEGGPADFPLNGMVAIEDVEGKWVERWRLRPR
jgi:phosphohistidine phosphatase